MSETKYYVDKKGTYLGGFAGGTVPKNAAQEVMPPKHGKDTWSFVEKRWIPYEPPAQDKRRVAFEQELGPVGDQLDALYKGLAVVIPALVRSNVLTQEEASKLLPDPEKPADEPGGWLAKISEIKARYPKELKDE